MGTSDLKSAMKGSGIATKDSLLNPGEPNAEMYLKQAEHLMKRGGLQPAIVYLEKALTLNPVSKVSVRSSLAQSPETPPICFVFILSLYCFRLPLLPGPAAFC